MSLRTYEKGFRVTHNQKDALYNHLKVSFCPKHIGRNQTFGEDGIDEGVGKQAFSHTARGSGN